MNQAIIVFLHRTFDGFKALSQIVSRTYGTSNKNFITKCPPRTSCKKVPTAGKIKSKSCRVCAFWEIPKTKSRIKCNDLKVVDSSDPCACVVPNPHPEPPGCHPFKSNVPLRIHKDCKPETQHECFNKCYKGSKYLFIIKPKCIKE